MIYLKTSIGIELRGEDMLISSLQSNFSGGVFTHFKRIANYRIRDKEDVRQEVHFFFKLNRLSKDNVVLGIPRRDMVLRYLDLPPEVSDDLKQVIRYQVQSFEPTEEDRFYYDYIQLGKIGPQKRLSILLVMVRKTLLDERLQLLHWLGIRPVSVIGSSMGLSNVFLQNRKDLQDKTYILADLSTSALEIAALRHGEFAYSREVPKGSDQSWRDLILSEVGEAASKMRLGAEDTIEKIVLAGESSESAQEDIRASIADCELLKTSIRFAVPEENAPHVQEAASALGLALTGMAHRPSIRMNLLPTELRIRQSRLAYVPAAIFGLALMGLLLALGFRQTVQEEKLVGELDQETMRLKVPVDRARSIQLKAEELEKRVKSIEEILGKRDLNLEILQELTVILPPDTFLNTYHYRDGTVQLTGASGSSSDLIPKLEKSPLLKDVVPRGSIFKDPQTGKDRFNFEAKLEK
jgi:Tfp pilus assembly protein PilN